MCAPLYTTLWYGASVKVANCRHVEETPSSVRYGRKRVGAGAKRRHKEKKKLRQGKRKKVVAAKLRKIG